MSNLATSAFTQLHKELTADLLRLSMSHYSEVRQKAQENLNTCFRFHPYAYRLVVPALLKAIEKDSPSSHEEFKGALYVLLGKKGRSVLTVSDWETLNTVWLAVVNAKHSEKPSVIKLLNDLSDCVQKYFETIWIEHRVPENVKQLALQAWSCGVTPALPCPSAAEIENGNAFSKKVNDQNLACYQQMVHDLAKVIEDGNLHWRYVNLAFTFLAILVRYDVKFPTEGVRVLTKNLIHDTIYIRKICISWVSAILKQQKRPHAKKILDLPDRNSNTWVQYRRNIDYSAEAVWKSTRFVFKPHYGFYCWPKEVKIADFENEPLVNRTRDQLPEEEVPIYDFFDNQANVDKLMEYFSLEGISSINFPQFYMCSLSVQSEKATTNSRQENSSCSKGCSRRSAPRFWIGLRLQSKSSLRTPTKALSAARASSWPA